MKPGDKKQYNGQEVTIVFPSKKTTRVTFSDGRSEAVPTDLIFDLKVSAPLEAPEGEVTPTAPVVVMGVDLGAGDDKLVMTQVSISEDGQLEVDAVPEPAPLGSEPTSQPEPVSPPPPRRRHLHLRELKENVNPVYPRGTVRRTSSSPR